MLNGQAATGRAQDSLLRLIAAFVLGGAISAVIASFAAVYLLGLHDPKFQNSLSSAFQVELIGMAILVVVSSVIFGLVLAIRVRSARASGRGRLSLILGVGYPIALILLGQILGYFDPESATATIAGIGLPILYSVLAAILVSKH